MAQPRYHQVARDGVLLTVPRERNPRLTKRLRELIEYRLQPLARELTRIKRAQEDLSQEEREVKKNIRSLQDKLIGAHIYGVAWEQLSYGVQLTLKSAAEIRKPVELLEYVVRRHRLRDVKKITLQGEILEQPGVIERIIELAEALPIDSQRACLRITMEESFEDARSRRKIRVPDGLYRRKKATTEVKPGIKLGSEEEEAPEGVED